MRESRLLTAVAAAVFVTLLTWGIPYHSALQASPPGEIQSGQVHSLRLTTAPQPDEETAPPAIPLNQGISRGEFPSLEAYRRAKAQADRRAQVAVEEGSSESDATPQGPEPLGHTIDVQFNGLNRNTAANNGFIFYPPDTTLAASSTKVLEAANSALRLFTTAGGVIATKNLNAFFSFSVGSPADSDKLLFDPKVFFDENAVNKRFFVVALDQETAPDVSRVYFAVSRSPDPTSLAGSEWCRYFFDSRWNVGTADESWADYPSIGMSKRWLGIGTNQFRFSNDTFTFAIVWVMSKLLLENNAASCPMKSTIPLYSFKPSSTAGSGTFFTLYPVQAYSDPSNFAGTDDPLYVVNTTGSASKNYRLLRIRGSSTPSMQIAAAVAGNFTYSVPPDAPQPGTGLMLDTGSQRITGAAGIGDAIYLVHGTACNFGGGSAESCVRYVRLLASQSAGAPVATISEQNNFGTTDNFRWWPNIAALTNGKVIVVYQASGSTLYLSWRYTGKPLGGVFEAPQALTSSTGTCARTTFGSPGRTGDYVGAFRDPGDASFWVAGERATTFTSSGGCSWATRIGKVTPP